MRKLLLMLFLTWFSGNVFAQNHVIKGRVVDEHDDPMPGVTITLKGTNQRTSSNGDGGFSLSVPDNSSNVLVFTFISYESQELNVKGLVSVSAKMKPTAKEMQEVVVTALNINRSSRSLGVSQQTVKVEDMTEARAANIVDLLDGKVPGLQLTTSGQATGSTRVVIRGAGSITGDNQPLWVVDGVPIENNDGQTTNGGNNPNNIDYGNSISALNPDDIQSITVLQGANAAALYGSRAANGAIIVTTKKGRKNAGIGVSVNENYMASRILQFPDFQNVYGEGGNSISGGQRATTGPYIGYYLEGTNGGSYGGPLLGQPLLAFNGLPSTYSPHPDNVTSLYQTAYAVNQNFAISQAFTTKDPKGGPELNSAYRLSFSRLDANDVMQKQDLQTKNNIAFNASKDFTNFLRIETRLQYLKARVQNRTARNEDPNNPLNIYNNLVRNASVADFSPYKDANGNELTNGTTGLDNPYWIINENYNQDITNTLIGGLTLTAKLLPGLTFRGQVSTNMNWGNRSNFIQKGAINAAGKLGAYSEFNQNNQVWNTEGLFSYSKRLTPKLTLDARLGGNIRKLDAYNQSAFVGALLTHDVMSLENNATVSTPYEYWQKSQTNSLYGVTSLAYNEVLYLDITGRNDWSSTLPARNRSFFYPSVSSSFIFSDAFKIPQNILTFGKLRASVAQVGNDTQPYNLYPAFNYRGSFNSLPEVAFDNVLKNSDLKPEKTTSVELGLELHFLKDRLTFNGTVYHKTTTNQILTGNISQASGFNSETINAGSVSNKGIELTLQGTPVRTKNFQWDVSGNFAVNRNRVNSLIPGLTSFRLGGALLTDVTAEVGQPIGVLRGEDWLKDAQGNVIINPSGGVPYSGSTPGTVDGHVKSIIGNYQPKSLESFTSTVKFKNFDFSFTLNGRMGGQIFSATQYRADVKGVTQQTLPLRDAYEMSAIVLGEGAQAQQTGTTSLYGLPYPDAARPKGPVFPGYYPLLDGQGNIVFDKNGLPIADKSKPNIYTVNSNVYYVRYNHISSLLTYDDTFIKLSQVIIGYNVPRGLLNRTFIRSARVALVGRNLWTILQHTPRGIDPESAFSSGNVQGIEQGGALPYASYGVDLKLSF